MLQASEEVKHEAVEFMKARAIWEFFDAQTDGDAPTCSRGRIGSTTNAWV